MWPEPLSSLYRDLMLLRAVSGKPGWRWTKTLVRSRSEDYFPTGNRSLWWMMVPRDQLLFSSQRQIMKMNCMPWWHTMSCRIRTGTSHKWLHQVVLILWPGCSQLLFQSPWKWSLWWFTSQEGGSIWGDWTWPHRFKQKSIAKRLHSNSPQWWLNCLKWRLD